MFHQVRREVAEMFHLLRREIAEMQLRLRIELVLLLCMLDISPGEIARPALAKSEDTEYEGQI